MSTRPHLLRRVGAACAVTTVICLAAAACSGGHSAGSGGSVSSRSAAGATTGKPSGDPIKIGYAASMSGPQSNNGLGAKAVAHAWQEYTNAHGGILGHPVEVEMKDTKNTTPGAISATKALIADHSIDAVMLTDLVAEGTMVDTLKNSDVAILSGGGSSDLLWTSVPGVFQDVSGSNYTIKSYVDQAKSDGATKFGWVACAEVAVCQTNGQKALTYAKSLGLGDGGEQMVSALSPDYTAQCLSFIANGTNSLAFNIGFTVGARFATDCIQQGYKGTFSVINSGFDQKSFSKVTGFKSVGGTQGFPWWAQDPQVQIYRDAMAKYSPDGIEASGNSTAIWTSFELLKKALENTKPSTIDRATVLDAMYSIKNETLGGLLAQPVTFTKGQPSKPIGCSWLFKYDAGDANPTSIEPAKSGNGASGDLASTCIGYLPGL